MSNDTKNQISIVSLRKQLHIISSNVPASDPFSRQGMSEWNEWAQSCREIESQIRDQGEYF